MWLHITRGRATVKESIITWVQFKPNWFSVTPRICRTFFEVPCTTESLIGKGNLTLGAVEAALILPSYAPALRCRNPSGGASTQRLGGCQLKKGGPSERGTGGTDFLLNCLGAPRPLVYPAEVQQLNAEPGQVPKAWRASISSHASHLLFFTIIIMILNAHQFLKILEKILVRPQPHVESSKNERTAHPLRLLVLAASGFPRLSLAFRAPWHPSPPAPRAPTSPVLPWPCVWPKHLIPTRFGSLESPCRERRTVWAVLKELIEAAAVKRRKRRSRTGGEIQNFNLVKIL